MCINLKMPPINPASCFSWSNFYPFPSTFFPKPHLMVWPKPAPNHHMLFSLHKKAEPDCWSACVFCSRFIKSNSSCSILLTSLYTLFLQNIRTSWSRRSSFSRAILDSTDSNAFPFVCSYFCSNSWSKVQSLSICSCEVCLHVLLSFVFVSCSLRPASPFLYP